jgi:integrase
MHWASVDFERGVMDFLPEKTRRKNKRVVVPLYPALLSHLQLIGESSEPGAFICPDLATKPTGGKNGLSASFKRVMAAAGVDPRTSEGLGVRRFSKLSFHALRHSFNSALANAGVPQETRMLSPYDSGGFGLASMIKSLSNADFVQTSRRSHPLKMDL